MITVFITRDKRLCEAINNELSLERDESDIGGRRIYHGKGFSLILLDQEITPQDIAWVNNAYMPDTLVIPFIGFSVNSQHQTGDIVFPNVFLMYNPLIQMKKFTKDQHHTLLGEGIFLEQFHEQRDYQVEDFGLSVWGIVVDRVILEDTEHYMSALDFTYEADIYTTDSLRELASIATETWNMTFLGYIANATKNSPDFKPENMGENILVSLSLVLGQEDEW